MQKCKYSHFDETLAFIVCYDQTQCWKREFDKKLSGEIDAAITTTYMMLEITNQSLGSTWVMHFIPEAIIEEFEILDYLVPVSILVADIRISAKPSTDTTKEKSLTLWNTYKY